MDPKRVDLKTQEIEKLKTEQIKKLKNAISSLRKTKKKLNDRVAVAIELLDTNYKSTLSTINQYISTAEGIIHQLSSDPLAPFYDCFLQPGIKTLYINPPDFSKDLKPKKLNVFKMDPPEGIFLSKNIKTCQHSNSHFFRSACEKIHCFDCLNTALSNIDLSKFYPQKSEQGYDIPTEAITATCPCDKQLTLKDLLTLKSLKKLS